MCKQIISIYSTPFFVFFCSIFLFLVALNGVDCVEEEAENVAIDKVFEQKMRQLKIDYSLKVSPLFKELEERKQWLEDDNNKELEKRVLAVGNETEKSLEKMIGETMPLLIAELEQFRLLSMESAVQRRQILEACPDAYAELANALHIPLPVTTSVDLLQASVDHGLNGIVEQYKNMATANFVGLLRIHSALQEVLCHCEQQQLAAANGRNQQQQEDHETDDKEVKSVLGQISAGAEDKLDQPTKKLSVLQRIKVSLGKRKIFWAADWLLKRQLKCDGLYDKTLTRVCNDFKTMIKRHEHLDPTKMYNKLSELYVVLLEAYQRRYKMQFVPKHKQSPLISAVVMPFKFAFCTLKAFLHVFPKSTNAYRILGKNTRRADDGYTQHMFEMVLNKLHSSLEEAKAEVLRGDDETNVNRKARPIAGILGTLTKHIGMPALMVALVICNGIMFHYAGLAVIGSAFASVLISEFLFQSWQLWIQNCF